MIKREVIWKNYLDLLDKNTNSFKKGQGKNIALLGPRKSGKTSIVKEHLKNTKDVVPVYIDLNRISLNPENFSIEFIGNILFHFLKRPLNEYKKFQLLENLLKAQDELKKNSFSLIKVLENELLKIKPDQKLLVETAFKFAEVLSNEANRKILIVLDNFENLLDLNNFSQIKDVLSLVNFNAQNMSYIAASSAVKQTIDLLKSFTCYEIKNLEKKDGIELIESIIGKDAKSAEQIFSFSNGHPLITILVSRRFNETKSARDAFLIELLQKNNPLYEYCSSSLDYYYSRARGQTLLKAILKVIANDELRLSDIARKIYRSAPVAKSVIERLIDVDIIYKKDNKFYFSDNVLRLWLKLTSMGYDFDDAPDEKTLDEAAKLL